MIPSAFKSKDRIDRGVPSNVTEHYFSHDVEQITIALLGMANL